MSDLGTYQNKIADLPSLTEYRYENIFKVYKTEEFGKFYNILKTISLKGALSESMYYTVPVNGRMPWTIISYRAYQTIDLWWLILLVNGIMDPTTIKNISSVKIIKPEFVHTIITQIKQQLQ